MTLDKLTFIVGLPRSGTTWLAKIFDSHPLVLYRHEPDIGIRNDLIPFVCESDQLEQHAGIMRDHIAELLRCRSLKSAGSLPIFRKSYDTAVSHAGRTALVHMLRILSHFLPRNAGRRLTVPDVGNAARASGLHHVIKSVSAWGQMGLILNACPQARVILIVRHAPGQVASRLRGIDKGKFEGSPEFDSPLLATRQAQRLNLTEATIRRMSLAQQLAWEWAVQNEIAIDALRDNPRARIIRYGDLVDDPVNQARALLSFAGLPWHPSVEEFVATSTHYQGPDRYYQVLKDSPRTKDKWQRTLSQAEREQIMEVMRASPVGQLWPELIGERAPAPNGTTDPGWLCNLGRADADLRAASCARG